jgi:hypothetical protein
LDISFDQQQKSDGSLDNNGGQSWTKHWLSSPEKVSAKMFCKVLFDYKRKNFARL